MLSEQDIEGAKKLGYIVNVPSGLAAQQINAHFPGIDLITLLNELEGLLEPHTKRPPYKRIIIDETPAPYLQIIYLSSNYAHPVHGLTLSRIFKYEQNKLIVKHDYLVFPQKARGQGLGKQVLGIWYDQYANMGVKHIYVHAGLKDGGAVWARMGFKALYRDEMERILRSAKRKLKGKPELDDVIAIFNSYYYNEPNGKAFPVRRWADIDVMEIVLKNKRNNWHGWIDLTIDAELGNFKTNVGR